MHADSRTTPTTSLTRALCCAAMLCVLSLAGCGGGGAARADGPSPRDVTLLDLDGNPVAPLAAPRTRITVFVFARTDCPISNRYAPEMIRLIGEFEDTADFYLVYPDPEQTPAAIREHLKAYGYPCPGLRDPEHALVRLTGATVTPEAVVFDTSDEMVYRGRIDDRFVAFGKARNAASRHDLEDALRAALAGEPAPNRITKAVGCYITDLTPTTGDEGKSTS